MKKAQILFSKPARRILGFLMRNRGFQAVGAGIYLSGNEQAHRAESTIYRKKTKSKTKPKIQ